jgi:hypothetical protein
VIATAYAAPEAARPADAFVDTIGVGVHAHYDDTAYGKWGAVVNAVASIGVRHVRRTRGGIPTSSPACG